MNHESPIRSNEQKNREGRYKVIVRIDLNGKRKAQSTHITIANRKDLNTKCRGENWIRQSVPDYAIYNRQLKELRNKLSDAYNRLPNPGNATPEDVVIMMNMPEDKKEENPPSVLTFFQEEMELLKVEGGYNNWKNTNNFYNKFVSFLKSKKMRDVYFSELNLRLI